MVGGVVPGGVVVVLGGVVVVLGEVVVVPPGGVVVPLGGVDPGRLLGGMLLGGKLLGVAVPVGGHGVATVEEVVPLVPAVPVALGVVLPMPADEVVPALLPLGLVVVPPGEVVLVLPLVLPVVLEPVLVPVAVVLQGFAAVLVLLPGVVVPVWLGVVVVDWLGVVVVLWLGVVVVVCEGVVPVVLGLVCVVEGLVCVAEGLPMVPAPDGAVEVEPTPVWAPVVPGVVVVPVPEPPVA